MSVISSGIKFVRRELGNIAGEEGVRVGAGLIRSAFSELRNRARQPSCPSCSKGRLYPLGDINGVDYSDILGCSQCDYFRHSDQYAKSIRAATSERYKVMSAESRIQVAAGHTRMSRLYYSIALLILLIDGYVMASGGAGLTALCLSGFGIALLARGVRSAYRYWQVREGRFFEEGLFNKWLRAGEWLV